MNITIFRRSCDEFDVHFFFHGRHNEIPVCCDCSVPIVEVYIKCINVRLGKDTQFMNDLTVVFISLLNGLV